MNDATKPIYEVVSFGANQHRIYLASTCICKCPKREHADLIAKLLSDNTTKIIVGVGESYHEVQPNVAARIADLEQALEEVDTRPALDAHISRISKLESALLSMLNLEGAARLGAQTGAFRGLDVAYHCAKARAALNKE